MKTKLYTFAEYLEDNVMHETGYAIRVTARELAAVWDLYSESYIDYCKQSNYEYEIIS